jgi:hypothetical protein
MSVYCGCCVLPGRGLCEGLITRAEVSYRVCVCEREFVSQCMSACVRMSVRECAYVKVRVST